MTQLELPGTSAGVALFGGGAGVVGVATELETVAGSRVSAVGSTPASTTPVLPPTRVRKRRTTLAVNAHLKRDEYGPLSPETGGRLSAAEAERVATGKSLVLAGRAWQGGAVACWPCVESKRAPEWPDGQGYRVTIYGDTTRRRACGKCIGCGAEVFGEHTLMRSS